MTLVVEPLFHPQIIEKYSKTIIITEKQKQFAKEWLEFLDVGLLNEEVKRYPVFLTHILIGILGYESKNIPQNLNVEFPLQNNEGNTIVSCEVKPYGINLLAKQHRQKKVHETPIEQCWNYMGLNNSRYGICTNYDTFYLLETGSGLKKVHEFKFSNIKKDENKLKEFIFLFSQKNLQNPKFVENLGCESIKIQDEFTDEFYKIYQDTRLMLIQSFNKKLKSIPESVRYSQLLLNRLIFVFFLEDKHDIPESYFFNNVEEIIKFPLIDVKSHFVTDFINDLFNDLNQGDYKKKIPGYNGGLFKESFLDDLFFLDLVSYADEKSIMYFKDQNLESRLHKSILRQPAINPLIINLMRISHYNFNSELNVNILGHIFEQSINDIEEIILQKNNQRKKEGVYYTPEHVTEFICRNTIIPYLSKSNTNDVKKLIMEYEGELEKLKFKLDNLKILDLACGSGAFLLKAVDIIIEIQEEIADFTKFDLVSTLDNTFLYKALNQKIIENNIFGVDLNPESVEITKLGLFLKIANVDEKLSDLSKNIISGNSINPNLFNWNEVFPNIKFDIIIGNPPYLQERDNKKQFDPIKKSDYNKYYQGKMDFWFFFLHKALDLIKEKGRIGFITNSYWVKNHGASKLICRLKKEVILDTVVDLEDKPIFRNVSGKHMIQFYIKKSIENDTTTYFILKDLFLNQNIFKHEGIVKPYLSIFTNLNKLDFTVNDLVFKNTIPLGKITSLSTGIQESPDKLSSKNINKKNIPGFQSGEGVFVLTKDEINEKKFNTNEMKIIHKYLQPKDVGKYYINFDEYYVIFSDKLIKNMISKNNFPNIKKHLDHYNPFITSANKPYGLHRPRKLIYFKNPKIIFKGMFKENSFYYDEEGYISGFSTIVVFQKSLDYDLRYILAILNSKLAQKWFTKFGKKRGGGVDVSSTLLKQFPIKIISDSSQKHLIDLVNGIQNGSLDYEKAILKIDKQVEILYDLNYIDQN